jgi:hypothetical protein
MRSANANNTESRASRGNGPTSRSSRQDRAHLVPEPVSTPWRSCVQPILGAPRKENP